MGVKNMQGVYAYLEYVGPRGRKRKTSCIYNNQGECNCKHSAYYLFKCGGRRVCNYFDDTKLEREIHKNNLSESNNDKSFKNIITKQKVRKFKIEDIETKKKYLAQLVEKDKENERACIFYRGSEIGRLFIKSKVGDYVEFMMNGEKHKFKVLEIN